MENKNGKNTDAMLIDGVWIESRYNCPKETAVMAKVISLIPYQLRLKVLNIFCDSKAQFLFIVHWLKKPTDKDMWWFDHAFREIYGHNGITHLFNEKEIGNADPFWSEEVLP